MVDEAKQAQIVGYLRERQAGKWIHGVSDTELFKAAADAIEGVVDPPPPEADPEVEAEAAETEERYPKRKR
jgi:hypothetical protein